MPAPFVDYYQAVAERIVPFLVGRHVAVEQHFPSASGPIFRRHEGSGADQRWIKISSPADVVRWARNYAVAFHGHLRPEGPGCWGVIDIDARRQSLAMARLAALHAVDVLAEQNLQVLPQFSGSDGFHLVWTMPSLRGLGGRDIWTIERAVVRAVAAETNRRLSGDERAAPLREAIGSDRPWIVTGSQDAVHRDALLFDEFILKPNVNTRVPWSLHAGSGRVAIPLDRDRLEQFEPADADIERTVALASDRLTIPANELSAVTGALAVWNGG